MLRVNPSRWVLVGLAFAAVLYSACSNDENVAPAPGEGRDAGRDSSLESGNPDSGIPEAGLGDADSGGHEAEAGGDSAIDTGSADAAGCAHVLSPSSDDVSALQGALIEAHSGDDICLVPGTYHFDKLITLNGTADLTVRGLGATRDSVVLDFAAQTSGDDAFTVSADGFTIENLTIKDAPGDGVKVTKSDRPTFRNVRAYYSTGSLATNGSYALYPAESTNVLIENCEVSGSSDAAIYLGQSTTGIVRNNLAHDCVIGIEAENSEDVEIYGNEAWGNTTGILVVNLPNLPLKRVRRISVHDNISRQNNRANFGDGFAKGLPAGSGMVVMGSHQVEIFDNIFLNNDGVALILVSWPTFALLSNLTTTDTVFEQYTQGIYVHDNTFRGNGTNPRDVFKTLGFSSIEDITWDGKVDSSPDAGTSPEAGTADDRRICIKNNGTARFRNLNIPDGIADKTKQSTDLAPFNCTLPPLTPVSLPDQ